MASKLLAASLLLSTAAVLGHPICINNSGPSTADANNLSGFCAAVKAKPALGSCCNPDREAALKATKYDNVAAGLSDACKPLHAQVVCTECSPYAQVSPLRTQILILHSPCARRIRLAVAAYEPDMHLHTASS
jgi:hypothetical protein